MGAAKRKKEINAAFKEYQALHRLERRIKAEASERWVKFIVAFALCAVIWPYLMYRIADECRKVNSWLWDELS